MTDDSACCLINLQFINRQLSSLIKLCRRCVSVIRPDVHVTAPVLELHLPLSTTNAAALVAENLPLAR